LSYIQLVLNVFKKKKQETEFVKGHSKARVTLVILKAWGSVIVNLPSLMRKRMSIRKKTVVAAIVLAMVGLFPFASNAFGVAFLSDIHASGKKKTATEGGNIIFPKNYKRCLAEMKDQKPDLVIAAGDLTDRGEKKYYRSLQKSMQGTKVLWAKGNHDGSRFNLLSEENYFIDFDGWRFIVLDSSRQFGSSTGFLENFQLSLLAEWLDTDKNIAIVMHHPPFFYNSRAGIYTEKKETVHDNLFNVLTPNVKYVLSGHWHFEKTAKIGGTTFLVQKALTQNNECNFTILELENTISNNGEDDNADGDKEGDFWF
jgi:3',5'-cyclic AMP phosphodiesterase CpdA